MIGINKPDDHSFFLVDANMQGSQNYGTTTGTAARVLRPSTEYQWSLLALPAPALKIFSIIISAFFPGPACISFTPPQSVSLLTNARSGPRRAGSAKCTSCANKFRKHIQNIIISIATHPRIPENDCRNCNFCNKKMRKDQIDFSVFSSFAIASLPVVQIQVEKTQRPCVWTPTLWSTPHLCTNLSLARPRQANWQNAKRKKYSDWMVEV